MRRATAAAAALLGALAWTSAAPAQDAARPAAGDAITWTEGGTRKTRNGVAVESADLERVVWSSGGRRTTTDGADVVGIRWGDAPAEFDAAEAALRNGDPAAAITGYEAVLSNRSTQRPWLAELGGTGLGEALLAAAPRDPESMERAARLFTAVRDANPRSFVLDRILLGLARTELLRGRPDAALDAAASLETVAKDARRPAWAADAALVRAECLDEKNDDAGATRVLDDLVLAAQSAAETAKDPDLARRLRRTAVLAAVRRTWLAVAAAETAKSAAATERVRNLASALTATWPGDPAAEAAATCAGGALLLLSGQAKSALRKFQEVEVGRFDVPEEAARALRYEALCFERLGDAARRSEAMRLLAESYAGTEAARRAR